MNWKHIGFIVLFLIGFLFTIRWFFQIVYYSNNPTIYETYQEKSKIEISQAEKEHRQGQYGQFIVDLRPPIGGCIKSCSGKTKDIDCVNYSLSYRRCQTKCLGYLFNICTSPKFFGQIWLKFLQYQ